jgi:hypothetical protein
VIEVPEGAFLTDGANLLQVVFEGENGMLYCEDAFASAEEAAEVKRVKKAHVVPPEARATKKPWQWAIVVPDRRGPVAA